MKKLIFIVFGADHQSNFNKDIMYIIYNQKSLIIKYYFYDAGLIVTVLFLCK